MEKKFYEAPIVRKVELVYKNAVLGVCHSSPNMYPARPEGQIPYTDACYMPNQVCPNYE